MSVLDIIFGAIFIWAGIHGFRKGFVIEFFKLFALVGGVCCSFIFSSKLAYFLQDYTSMSFGVLKIIAFAIVFIVTVLLIIWLAKLLTRLVDSVSLGILNKILGLIFSLLLTAFFISIVMFLINFIDDAVHFIPTEIRRESILLAPIEAFAPNIVESVGIVLSEQ